MKYVLVLLLGLLLGALAYRQISINPAPLPAPAAMPPAEGGPEQGGTPPADPDKVIPTVVPAPTSPPVLPPPSDVAPAQQLAGVDSLLIPVQGKAVGDLADTFTDARSQGRLHDAIDIMAAAGTPVLAVADGKVEKLFTSERGGLTMYQFEPGGQVAYYYAHLQRYADGLAEQQPLKRGQVIGYVGSTGNASPEAPHLHFAVFVLGPERRWWEGTAINPYPLLTGQR